MGVENNLIPDDQKTKVDYTPFSPYDLQEQDKPVPITSAPSTSITVTFSKGYLPATRPKPHKAQPRGNSTSSESEDIDLLQSDSSDEPVAQTDDEGNVATDVPQPDATRYFFSRRKSLPQYKEPGSEVLKRDPGKPKTSRKSSDKRASSAGREPAENPVTFRRILRPRKPKPRNPEEDAVDASQDDSTSDTLRAQDTPPRQAERDEYVDAHGIDLSSALAISTSDQNLTKSQCNKLAKGWDYVSRNLRCRKDKLEDFLANFDTLVLQKQLTKK